MKIHLNLYVGVSYFVFFFLIFIFKLTIAQADIANIAEIV